VSPRTGTLSPTDARLECHSWQAKAEACALVWTTREEDLLGHKTDRAIAEIDRFIDKRAQGG
jgi:hypothetical protein